MTLDDMFLKAIKLVLSQTLLCYFTLFQPWCIINVSTAYEQCCIKNCINKINFSNKHQKIVGLIKNKSKICMIKFSM